MVMIRIRGIYTTALTRLLSDAGFSFSDLTPITRSRFAGEVKLSTTPPKVTIKDRNDLKGIVILGYPPLVRLVSSFISYSVMGSAGVFIEEGPYTSYIVEIVSETRQGYVVRLPQGKTGLLVTENKHNPGDLVRAHIVRPSVRLPRLREGLALVGNYVRVIEGGKHSVSRHVRSEERKIELLQLAFRNTSTRWGIRFRSSSSNASLIEIAQEIQELTKRAEELLKEQHQAPTLLAAGEALADIYFARPATEFLDSIRCKHIPTLPLHHELKSLGEPGLDAKIDFAEGSVTSSNCFSKESVYRRHYLPRAGLNKPSILVHHVKLFDNSFLWTATPRYDSDKGDLLLERRVTSPGMYDGLGIRKEPGDKILSYTYLGSRIIVHQYSGKNDEIKGIYVNINTPLSIYAPGELWYIDLEADIVWPAGHEPQLVDYEKFKEIAAKALIQPSYIALYEQFINDLKREITRSMPGPTEILEIAREKEKIFRLHELSQQIRDL